MKVFLNNYKRKQVELPTVGIKGISTGILTILRTLHFNWSGEGYKVTAGTTSYLRP